MLYLFLANISLITLTSEAVTTVSVITLTGVATIRVGALGILVATVSC